MKSNFWKILAIAAIGIIMNSCKKNSNNWDTIDSNVQQHNEDSDNLKNESDNVNTEINEIIRNVSGFKKTITTGISVCGATIDSSQVSSATPTLLVNFDGTTTCANPSRIRSGTIKIELINGQHWEDAGAILRVTHINYKVKFVNLNNHFVTFNGVKYLTNVDGINWYNYFLQGQVTAKIKERMSNMAVTFDNGYAATWNMARITDWKLTAATNIISVKVNADTTINGKLIDSWGTNRFGNDFTTEMQQAWEANSLCGWWKPTKGIYFHTTPNFTLKGTFGVDQNGNQQSAGCAYGLKAEWTITATNRSGVALISYFW